MTTDARNTGGPRPTVCGLKHDGLVAPTGTTCQQYSGGTAPALVDGLQYTTTKDGSDQRRLPGRVLLLHEGHGDGDGDTVGITESNNAPVPRPSRSSRSSSTTRTARS